MTRRTYCALRVWATIWVFVGCLSAFGKNHIVLFKQAADELGALEPEEIELALQAANAKSIGELKKWLGQGSRSSDEIHDLWFIRAALARLSNEQALNLAKEPWVYRVEEDRVVKLVSPMNDLVVVDKLDTAHPERTLWGLILIGLPKIKSEFPKLNGKSVRVGIIDTGIQSHHTQFERWIGTEPSYLSVRFRDFINGIASPYDDHGHGTHVAGTIAGTNVGIAPNASLIVAKSLDANGSGSISTLIKSMQWMMDPDGNPKTKDYAQVVNNSWGASLDGESVIDIVQFEAFHRAVQAWVRSGIVPIFSAGNSSAQPNGIPAGFAESVSIGAIDSKTGVASFSSRGPNIWNLGTMVLSLFKPDISAPGVEVTSAFPGDKYATWSGTSMASPHVTGSIALALQANPKLSVAKVKELLLQSSSKKMDLSYGYGVLNAHALVKLANQ